MAYKRALQITLAILSLIPLTYGTLGLIFGASRLAGAGPVTAALDNQFRYLSGWYFALAMLCWWMIPRIEREGTVFRIICAAVFLGGIGRLVSLQAFGAPPPEMMVGLALELGAPLLIFWQMHVARGT